jgi:hypothetical protein
MAAEDIQLVKSVHPRPETELTQLFRSERGTEALKQGLAPALHPEFEMTALSDKRGLKLDGKGIDGLVDGWRQWLEPWDIYWSEAEDFIDADEGRVLVHVRDHGKLRGTDSEVETQAAAVWTVRDGKIARIDFFADRGVARKAAGLD